MRRNWNGKMWGNQRSGQKNGLCKDPEMRESLGGLKELETGRE